MYIAHKRESDLKTQSLVAHLQATAYLARDLADSFDNGDYAYICGLLHDIGKYSDNFQNKIEYNLNNQVDHSTAGAIEANRAVKGFGKLLSYCIAGHHGGLPDGGSRSDTYSESTLSGRLKRGEQLPDYSHYTEEISISNLLPVSLPNILPLNKGGFSLAFFTRMIYSCLVDSDFLDTERFMCRGEVERCHEYDYQGFKNKLNAYIESFKEKERDINKKRREILSDCINKAKQGKGLYTLTVPTGGGKTVSSLAFAINHLIEYKMDRIIYVIPYTSIIEQTGKVFKDILGYQNVLEHHSNFEFKDDEYLLDYKLKLATENWDIPIVITTNVQFFESLFANKSSKCRKLHNIANSIVIFDEAQMLPTQFLTPCIMAISELVVNYKCTCILCSATQPALKDKFPKEVEIKEICQDTKNLYEFFRRTKIVNRGKIEAFEVAEEINRYNQALCIVNSKKHALEIFSRLKGEGIFHLSTRMCPMHRKDILSEIKERLKSGQPCRVVSTQLIEAGVDVDFPVVYRALAGIDSIVQAGGRCNREGRDALGIIHVFEPESDFIKHMPASLKRPAEVARSIMTSYEDILSPEAIHAYFKELYSFEGEMGLDINGIFKELEKGAAGCNFNFRKVAEQFKLIEENTTPVIIPLGTDAEAIINRLRYAENYKSALREIQPYTVNVYEQEFHKMLGANMLETISDGVYVLKDRSMYNDKTGLGFVEETGIGIFI